jgi:hypothetical protein
MGWQTYKNLRWQRKIRCKGWQEKHRSSPGWQGVERVSGGESMNQTEVKQIIANYQPSPGFFDLSEKPAGMPETDYAKILKYQNFLVDESRNAEYLKQYDRCQWEKLQAIAGELQNIILMHWKIEEI